MDTMRADWNERVAFVKVNVDDPEIGEALGTYSVSGTPSFVLFDQAGTPTGRFGGWPGEPAVEGYLAQLIQ